MNSRPTIREQMDACRPGSDDPYLPEHAADLAELVAGLRENGEIRSQWERSQHNDRILRGVIQDVSLPAGLEARLLATLQAAESTPLACVEQVVRNESPASEHPVFPAAAKASRRWFLKVAVSLGGIAAMALAAVLTFQGFKQSEQPITRDQLVTQVEAWLGAVDRKAMSSATKADLAAFPDEIVLGRALRSGTFASAQGRVTAFDVTQDSSHATLLVIHTTKVYPVGTFPLSNLPGDSGGWQVRAWQYNEVLYVIAVRENSDARLDQFIRPQSIG